jgi:guanylate kinase
MIVITGKTATGKTTLVNILGNRGIKKTVTDTTRSPRTGEQNGVDYNFLSEIEFDENLLKGIYAETTSYQTVDGNTVKYGSRRAAYDEQGVIILNPDGVRTLRKNNVPFFCVCLDATYDTIRNRIKKRGDDPAAFEKRLEQDEVDFLGIDLLCDFTIHTDDLTPEEIADIIIDAESVYDDDFVDEFDEMSDEDLAESLFEQTKMNEIKPEEFLDEKTSKKRKKAFWKNRKKQEIAKLYGNTTCYKESHVTKAKKKQAKKEPNYVGIVADAKKTASMNEQVRDYETTEPDEKLLIIGRTASGKDTLQYALEKRGMTFVKSYTTRPKRAVNEDTHIFIKPDQVAPKNEMAAYTVINGYEYFATKEQVNNADAYIIDPEGLKMLVENMPDTRFRILYMIPLPSMQEEMAISREEDKEQAEERFKKRSASEDAMFREFDKLIMSGGLYPNCRVTKFVNTYDDRLYAFADRIRLK